jgi:hypothetical protein
MDTGLKNKRADRQTEPVQGMDEPVQLCDRCGCEMFEKNCKIVCPNCGNRFDCSDLNIYFD